ncbi:hypothetical protein XENTR_v10024951 [Xenopus tropicalis]|nr:hypothetical protein XENTR_v10024951 [Xenopus tropicalis]
MSVRASLPPGQVSVCLYVYLYLHSVWGSVVQSPKQSVLPDRPKPLTGGRRKSIQEWGLFINTRQICP